jgi:uncharacterized SAM-binding protein YcdF (DUF218 family)
VVYEPLRPLTQPLTFLLALLLLTTLASLRRSAGRGWRWMVLAVALSLAAVSHPYAAWAAAHALESQYPPVAVEGPLPSLRALVVLSGGLMSGSQREGVLAEDSIVRTICGARLARRINPELIVVTGGVVSPSTQASAAQRMRDLMVIMGIPTERILVEGHARNTVDNASMSAALLAPYGIRRVGLVTEAVHMPRSVGIFRAHGYDVVPLSCEAQTGPAFGFALTTLLPGPRAAWLFNRAAHEWISLSYYRFIGDWK